MNLFTATSLSIITSSTYQLDLKSITLLLYYYYYYIRKVSYGSPDYDMCYLSD